ncbi:MAG: glutathione S-transferase family protein [Deltaproteobacteria bacterium]|nr:glutathione S-transferase family protein [Deltaproteobacteria bacterium]MCW5803071.1 glutathione S-transferase family protein [Deltaproteobacteria bacterium]
MKLELVSWALCPFVHRAAIMLREKGVRFDKTYIDLDDKPPWFLRISPRGRVPVLIAGGVPLFESLPIIEFLDEIHPPHIIPTDDPFERARQRAWVEVANDLLAAQRALLLAPGEAEVAAATTELASPLARFEEALRTRLIDPDHFGLVAIASAPALHRFLVTQERCGLALAAAAPRLEAWARTVAARPSVRDTVPHDFPERWLAYFADRGGYLISRAVAHG